jgi:hypothetical protein
MRLFHTIFLTWVIFSKNIADKVILVLILRGLLLLAAVKDVIIHKVGVVAIYIWDVVVHLIFFFLFLENLQLIYVWLCTLFVCCDDIHYLDNLQVVIPYIDDKIHSQPYFYNDLEVKEISLIYY